LFDRQDAGIEEYLRPLELLDLIEQGRTEMNGFLLVYYLPAYYRIIIS